VHITTDNFPLYLSAAAAVLACVAYLASGLAGKSRAAGPFSRVGAIACWIVLACVAFASVRLLLLILSKSRYDIAYVHDYSAPRTH